jgi:hypothetical protein
MPNGKRFDEFLDETIPRLLVALGKRQRAAKPNHGRGHTWFGYPLFAAVGVRKLTDIPPVHRRDAITFLALFDSGLVPLSAVLREHLIPNGDKRIVYS